MEWRELFNLRLSANWQYSKPTNIRDFKVEFVYADVARNSIVLIALANVPSQSNKESTEFFKPQQIKPLVESEIIRFAEPIKGWQYRIAIKQAAIPRQPLPETRVKVFMPVVDLTPDQPVINPAIATAKIPTSVPVGPASNAAVKLLPVNSANARKHATFYNPSATRNIYIDTDSTVNTTSAVGKVGPGKIYISDFPNWQGEYWGLLDGTGATAVTVAVEEYL